ncbi:vitamin B12 dependent-methionine synthase activation domain-containing protein [Gottschalkiaceae bacterium SANA]|nr:vitamin B12 dependent-methionine synthase activation domain-containing protein [Gottschalkiaceae bacterium SANA]
MRIEEVIRYLGYQNNQVDQQTRKRVQEVMQIVEDTIDPRWDFQSFERHEWSKNRVTLRGLPFCLQGESIAKHLQDASRVFLMAATLGVEAERMLMRMQAISMTDAMILDSCLSTYVEGAADQCQEEIKKLISESEQLTFRFSPGYGDFPLAVHQDMIRSLRWDRTLGITVTSSMMMVPSKSVIAIIGVEEKCDKNKEKKDKMPCGNKSCEVCKLKETCNWKK